MMRTVVYVTDAQGQEHKVDLVLWSRQFEDKTVTAAVHQQVAGSYPGAKKIRVAALAA